MSKTLIKIIDLIKTSGRQTKLDLAYVAVIGLALLLAVFRIIPRPQITYLLAGLAIIGILPVLFSAIKDIKDKKVSVDLLATIALTFAFLGQEWSSAAFINLMLASARIFGSLTENSAKDIIKKLLKYRPATVKIQKDNAILEIPIEQIKVGDLMLVSMGERLAVDGVIVSGQATINAATLTGESEPQAKTVGDQVYSSTLNEAGSLVVRVEKVGEDTTLSKIIRLVSQASREKATVENIGDRFAAWYISITLISAITIYLFTFNLNLVLALLLVVCADDIAVAVPLAFTVSIARAANRGIIIKGGEIIERLSKVKAILTDKTGTLTEGKPVVQSVEFTSNEFKNFLPLLGASEINSKHPMGKAIVEYIKQQGIAIPAPLNFDERPGEGISAEIAGFQMLIGKTSFLEKSGIKFSTDEQAIYKKLKAGGFSVVPFVINQKLAAFVVIKDAIRINAKAAIESSKEYGIKDWIMLTGDNERVAAAAAKELGITVYKANTTPEEKLQLVKKYRAEYGSIAMVGDGVNDAAALALADVGIAMGVIGSDVAIESADIALMNDELIRIPESLKLAAETISSVRGNFIIWGVTNAIGLILVLAGVLGPEGAAAYNFLTDFITIANSLKIFRVKFTLKD